MTNTTPQAAVNLYRAKSASKMLHGTDHPQLMGDPRHAAHPPNGILLDPSAEQPSPFWYARIRRTFPGSIIAWDATHVAYVPEGRPLNGARLCTWREVEDAMHDRPNDPTPLHDDEMDARGPTHAEHMRTWRSNR